MPITASLGALSYPRIYETTILPSGMGYGALIPGYQLMNGAANPLASNNGGYTNGIGVDNSGNLYLSGMIPGIGFPTNLTPKAGLFKLDNITGAPIYDQLVFDGSGLCAAVNSDDKPCHAVDYWYGGWSPINLRQRGYQTSGNNFVNYFTFGQETSGTTNDILGIKIDNSGNYYYYIQHNTNSLMVVKSNTNNVYVTRVSIDRATFSTLFSRDFSIDTNQNIYMLCVDNFASPIGIISKHTYIGSPIFYSLTWRKQLNYDAIAMAVNATHIFVLVSTASNHFSLVKLDSNGTIVLQKSYTGSIDIKSTKLSIGSDGNLYCTGPFASWDTDLNLRWCNSIGFVALNNTYLSPTGTAGIQEKNGYLYSANTVSYNNDRCIFAFKLPSDGTIPAPGIYWLGNGYMYVYPSSLTEDAWTTVTSTNSTKVINGTDNPSILTTTAFTDPITQDNLVINTEI